MGKIEARNNKKLKNAVTELKNAKSSKDKAFWKKEIKHLLDLPQENQDRSDRREGKLLSLDYKYEDKDDATTLMDYISSDVPDPLEEALKNEEYEYLYSALLSLPDKRDLIVVIHYLIYGESAVTISKIVGWSDKTVTKHYNDSLNILKKELQKNNEIYSEFS
ncbi:hypothetical protein OZX69_01425 [Lactobacillus sp. ESL0731]|uniref:RNA polymerase sigma factor n=1 Tax=unclassified Lactobacillus TaxID=2620435 RepID=UPI0023F6DCD0|nr:MULTISPECIES: hypothetical protein [unclassified Lactobacillus]WEV51410.1 hypothetical protein OZX63_01425 [Lactobacillus sp. ESL0700]WEV62540.1 hypothetical protein OZX69_01425 [Lactobacillus sp. ESL0731]